MKLWFIPHTAVNKDFYLTQIIPRWPSNPETRTESSESLISKNVMLMSASLTTTGRDFHAWFAPCGFPSSCPVFSRIQKLWADVLASLRRKLRGVCDAFSAILVHVCGSCDICGLLSVCGGTVDDSESDCWRFFFFFCRLFDYRREKIVWHFVFFSFISPSLIFSSSSIFSAPFLLLLESFPSSSLPCSFQLSFQVIADSAYCMKLCLRAYAVSYHPKYKDFS